MMFFLKGFQGPPLVNQFTVSICNLFLFQQHHFAPTNREILLIKLYTVFENVMYLDIFYSKSFLLLYLNTIYRTIVLKVGVIEFKTYMLI